MPSFSIQISAEIVAWYGAVIATFGFAMSSYNIWRDKAKIKIKYEPDMYVIGGEILNYKEGEKYLSISVINKGRRPVKIEKASLREYKNSKIILLADSFSDRRPKLITEESPTTTFFAKQDKINLEKIYCVIVEDGKGKKYKKYVKKFPTFMRLFYWISNKNDEKQTTN